MKLRNKKTGEIAEFDFIGAVTHQGGKIVDSLQYGLIAMFCNEWEDYIPTEPLIKDEKVREAIRTWAAAANVKTDKIRVSKGTFFTSFIGWIDGLVGGLEISFRTGDAFEAINDGAELTLTELCGEDEE